MDRTMALCMLTESCLLCCSLSKHKEMQELELVREQLDRGLQAAKQSSIDIDLILQELFSQPLALPPASSTEGSVNGEIVDLSEDK